VSSRVNACGFDSAHRLLLLLFSCFDIYYFFSNGLNFVSRDKIRFFKEDLLGFSLIYDLGGLKFFFEKII
jgi:hypothetical protein